MHRHTYSCFIRYLKIIWCYFHIHLLHYRYFVTKMIQVYNHTISEYTHYIWMKDS